MSVMRAQRLKISPLVVLLILLLGHERSQLVSSEVITVTPTASSPPPQDEITKSPIQLPTASISYVHYSWRRLIVTFSEPGVCLDVVIRPVYMNASSGQWNWTSESKGPSREDLDGDQGQSTHEPEPWMTDPDDLVSEITLECEGRYPIEWVYEGDGWPSESLETLTKSEILQNVQVRNSRISSGDGEGQNIFKSEIINLILFEKLTGKYSCRSVGDPGLHVSFYIFVPNNTVGLLDYLPPRTFLLESNPTIWLGAGEDKVRVPCSVSDPKAIVTLHELYDDGSESGIRLDLPFDPKKGFIVPAQLISWKRYKCIAERVGGSSEGSKSLQVFVFREGATRSSYFSVTPKQSRVLLQEDSSLSSPRPVQFLCDGYRRVSVETTGCLGRQKVSYTYNENGRYPFRAKVEVTPDKNQSGLLEIKCSSIDSGQILHTWIYSSYDESLNFKFEPQSRRFLCCAASSPRKPKLQVSECGSDLECLIRKPYHYSNSPDERDNEAFPEGCTGYYPVGTYLTEGIFRCQLGSNVKETHFIYNPVNGYGFILAENESQEESLGIQHSIGIEQRVNTVYTENEAFEPPNGEVLYGDSARFICSAPRHYFADGPGSIQWLLRKKDGSHEKITDSDCSSVTCFTKFDDLSVKEVICTAPLWRAIEWETAQFPIKIIAKNSRTPPLVSLIQPIQTFEKYVVLFPHTFLSSVGPDGTNYTRSKEELAIKFHCEAEYPIEWLYQGHGNPLTQAQVIRGSPKTFVNKTDGTSSWGKLVATLTILNWTVEHNTGRYICRRMNDNELLSYIDLFVAGDSLFLKPENQTLRIDTRLSSNITIPCPISNPSLQIELRKFNETSNDWVLVSNSTNQNSTTTKYDPFSGFLLSRVQGVEGRVSIPVVTVTGSDNSKVTPLSSPFLDVDGLYKCVESLTVSVSGSNDTDTNETLTVTETESEGGDLEEGLALAQRETGTIRVIDERVTANLVRTEPFGQVIVHMNPRVQQAFECHAKEEIQISFSEPELDKRIEATYKKDSSSEFPFSVSFSIDPNKLAKISNYTVINCTSVRTERVLHTWEYTNYGLDLINTFDYDDKYSSYICCSNSFYRPRLVFLPCHSVMDCRVQKSCFEKSDCVHDRTLTPTPSSSSSILDLGGCSGFKVENGTSEGLLQCQVAGLFHRHTTTFMFYTYFEENGFEIHTGVWNFEHNNKPVPTSAILKLEQETLNKTHSRFICSGSKFFFASGFKFALEKANGSFETPLRPISILPTSHGPDQSSRLIMATLDLKEKQLAGLTRVSCLAPEWKQFGSKGWRNVSMFLQGEEG